MLPIEFYFDAAIKGLLTGSVYAMLAVGLSIIFGVMRVVNFAHGEMLVAGMFGAYLVFVTLGLDPILAIPIVALVMFLFGVALQRGLIDRFITAPEHQQFLVLIGVALILTNGLDMIFGPDARNVQVPYAFASFEVGPFFLDNVRVYSAIAALALIALLYLFFNHTLTGKAIRACADNNRGAQVVGLNVSRLYAITFGIGAACAGAAGCLLIMVIDVTPHLGADFTLLAFTIVIIGGLGSMTGALLGGLLIGVSEAMAGILIQPSLKSSFSFGLLILVLLLRPNGLLGKRSS